MYGYPPSNSLASTNEDMIKCGLTYISSLNMPAVLLGDLNTTVHESPSLALLDMLSLRRIGSLGATTKGKDRLIAQGGALDHCIANMKACDQGIKGDVIYSYSVSDHCPIGGHWWIPMEDEYVWEWPKAERCSLPRKNSVVWSTSAKSYTQWSEYCVKWLRETSECQIASKGMVTTKKRSCAPMQPDREYARICAAQRALSFMMGGMHPPTLAQKLSLRRKLLCLGISLGPDLHALAKERDTRYLQYTNKAQEAALSLWKSRVKTWHATSKELYAYLKNHEAPKCVVVQGDKGPLSSPQAVAFELNRFWGSIESWPTATMEDDVRSAIEDRWSPFLPHHPMTIKLEGVDIHKQCKRQKMSCPGPDGWSLEELRLLPLVAWEHLLKVMKDPSNDMSATMMAIYKRIPLEKPGQDIPTADSVRPIDIYSMILRIVTASQITCLKPWLARVVHKTQYSTHGGALRAVTRLSVWAETIAQRKGQVWGLSVDVSKMFNSLSPLAAMDIARYCGLEQKDCETLVAPIISSKGCWRLGANGVTPLTRKGRGLPQGLSTSVALAELTVSTLLWKLEKTTLVESIGYMDDIHIATHCREQMVKAIWVLRQFVCDLCLTLAQGKTVLWGTERVGLQELSRDTGFPIATHLASMGYEWDFRLPGQEEGPKREKLSSRLDTLMLRLRRLTHLPAKLGVKGTAIVVGCLSLLAYEPPIKVQPVLKLRTAVKTALNQKSGSPEILFLLPTKTCLDPYLHWLLGLARHWRAISREEEGPNLQSGVSVRAPSLLGVFKKQCSSLGWTLSSSSLETPRHISWAWSGASSRE